MAVFCQSPSTNRRQRRGIEMRYLWYRFDFLGQFCDIKLFPVYGPRSRLGNFRSIFVRKHYYHLSLNLNNSTIWRHIDEIISEIVQRFALYKLYAKKTPKPCIISGQGPPENATFNISCNFRGPLYKLCKGLAFQLQCVFHSKPCEKRTAAGMPTPYTICTRGLENCNFCWM